MKSPTDEDIDARSELLIAEFRKHKAEFYSHMREESPEYLAPDGSLDEHKIFEGWILQKVAGLQLFVECYERVIMVPFRQVCKTFARRVSGAAEC